MCTYLNKFTFFFAHPDKLLVYPGFQHNRIKRIDRKKLSQFFIAVTYYSVRVIHRCGLYIGF